MLLSAVIPVVMVVGVLPYDISLSLFSTSDSSNHRSLWVALTVLYWVSFILTWVVVPIIVSFLRYANSISLKHRIWFTIRENLIVYGIILGVVVIGLVILFATKKIEAKASSVKNLAISLANGYGLIILCLCLGHGWTALPQNMWQMATPGNRYLFHLHKIAMETQLAASVVADCDSATDMCTAARDHLIDILRTKFAEVGQPRAIRLNQLKGAVPLREEFLTKTSSLRALGKFRTLEWRECSTYELEAFFSVLDDIIAKLEETTHILRDSSRKALMALRLYSVTSGRSILTVIQRIAAIAVALFNAVCVWGELCLMFDRKLSLFYLLSHVKMHPLLGLLGVSTPVLAYLVFVGLWSLTHLKLGSFFRFTRGTTNANTLNYFAIVLCRLGPTIGFHYMQQIAATKSQFQRVMGDMDEIIFIGTAWNIYSPVLLIIVMIVFAFRIPNKIAMCCGKDDFTLDYSMMNYDDLAVGEELLKDLEPDARVIIEGGLKWGIIVNEEIRPRFPSTRWITDSDRGLEIPFTEI
jgi:hypothetical protein